MKTAVNCNLNATEVLIHHLVNSGHTAVLPYIYTGFPPLFTAALLSISLVIPPLMWSSLSYPKPPRHNRRYVDIVSGVWGFLQEDQFRQTVEGDNDFRCLLLRNSFSVNWRFQDLVAKCTVPILSQWTVKERIYLLWAYRRNFGGLSGYWGVRCYHHGIDKQK